MCQNFRDLNVWKTLTVRSSLKQMVSIQLKNESVKQKYHLKPHILNTTNFNAYFQRTWPLWQGTIPFPFSLFNEKLLCLPHIHIDVFTLPPSDCWIAFNSMTLHSFYVEHYMWERFTASITFKTRLGSNSKPYVHKVFSISLTIFLVVRNLLSPIQDIPIDSRVQCT